MRQNPQDHRLPSTDRIKHLYFELEDPQNSSPEYSPFYYAEVRIDYNDVRTGFSSTVSLNKAIDIQLITPDLLWAEDMMRDIDPQKTKSSAPEAATIRSLPDFVDANFMSQMETQFINYLLRSCKAKVFRNFELDTYSFSGESLSEFTARCSDLLEESKRQELDALQDVFRRRLEQIKQKYLKASTSDNLETAKAESQNKNLFFRYSDRIAGHFLHSGPRKDATKNEPHLPGNNPDLEERLGSLELEAQRAISGIWDSYRKRAQSNDEYILHPNLKDIHFVRCCILWIPARMA
jgi:hypothetical protein